MSSVSNLKICKMEISEIKNVVSLWYKLAEDQLCQNEYSSLNIKDVKNVTVYNYFSDCYKNNNCEIFLAKHEDIIVGFAEIWARKKDFIFEPENYGYILHFFVDKKFYHEINPLSAPLKLFRECENWVREKQLAYLTSDVYGFNVKVQKLLEKSGAVPYKIRYVKRLSE